MASETFHGYGITAIAGRSATQETTENAVEWRMAGSGHRYKQVRVDSTAVDTGIPTNLLRPGLVMGELDSGAGFVDYAVEATNGSQEAIGILVEEVDLFDPVERVSQDRTWRLLIQGGVIASRLQGLDQTARNQLSNRIWFDDSSEQLYAGYRRAVEKVTDYTVLVADHGTLFLATTADVNFTLPTIAPGLAYDFLRTDDFELAVTSAAGNDIIAFNDVAASSVTFTTAANQISARVRVSALHLSGTLKWIVENIGGAHTLTVA